jgi:hypothetical protein
MVDETGGSNAAARGRVLLTATYKGGTVLSTAAAQWRDALWSLDL